MVSEDGVYGVDIPKDRGVPIPTQNMHGNMLGVFDYPHMPRNYMFDKWLGLGIRHFALCGLSRHSGLIKTAKALRQYSRYYEIEKEVKVGIVEDASMSLNCDNDTTVQVSTRCDEFTSLMVQTVVDEDTQQLAEFLDR